MGIITNIHILYEKSIPPKLKAMEAVELTTIGLERNCTNQLANTATQPVSIVIAQASCYLTK